MPNKIFVPHEGPKGAKIMFIGESPGEEEEREKRPFVGISGQRLIESLNRAGVSRDDVRLMNLSHYRPGYNNNKFELLLDTKELHDGIAEIKEEILTHPPTVIVPLGRYPLQFLTGKQSIHAWRGSILEYEPTGTKLIPTFHPSAVVRDYSLLPTFDADIFRIVGDSAFPERRLPVRNFIIDPRGLDLEEWVQKLEEAPELAVDIESTRKGDVGTKHILCIGFSPSPDVAVCIANHQDAPTANAFARLLSCPAKKIFHFGTFDTEALRINGYETRNYAWDTFVAQHVLNAELPRGLDYLTSIYTREPYYKATGRAEIPGDTKEWGSKIDREQLYIYNCKDAACTMEIKLAQEQELTEPNDIRMFHHEMSMIEVASEMTINGMPIDLDRRKTFEKALNHRWAKLQLLLNQICGKEVNVRSPKLKDVLYGDLKLPVRRNRDAGVTTDEDAIVSLITFVTGHLNGLSRDNAINEWKIKLLVLKTILEIRGLRQLRSNYILPPVSPDGRLRSIYSYSSTETGRANCSKYIDNSGCNSQTFPRGSVDVPEDLSDVVTFEIDDDEPNSTDDE